jgi:membrane protease YdiL (CAAX protease family)
VNLFAGFRHLITTFESFLDPVSLLPGMIGLFLIGVVLSYAFARTGDLWLSIGLHAGWVLSLKILKLFGNFSRADLGWAFGAAEPKIVSGMATWIGVVLVGLAVSRITRRAAPLASDQPHATAA